MSKTALVLGAGGFIGSHLVAELKERGYWVRGVDLKYPEFWKTKADDFVLGDLRSMGVMSKVMLGPEQRHLKHREAAFDEVYMMAANMGGAGYLFSGQNDSNVMYDNTLMHLNLFRYAPKFQVGKVFISSSACVYNQSFQESPDVTELTENQAYPAQPDSPYGWEKLYSEILGEAFSKCEGMELKIGRFHGIYGPYGTYDGGKEKAPAAICRKVAQAESGDFIEVWGDGEQTRSFLYVGEAVEAVIRLMHHPTFNGPVNIGSDRLISINDFTHTVADIAGKDIHIKHVEGPQGVRGRNSDNTLIHQELGWKPTLPLEKGVEITYNWINEQIKSNHGARKLQRLSK